MNAAAHRFSLNLRGPCTTHYIGVEQRPVVVIEDFMANPQSLLDWAESGEPFRSDRRDFYPGLRKPVPAFYAQDVCEKLGAAVQIIFSAFSITTTEPHLLRPVQRVPHFDSSAENQFAIVHYLCAPEHGGTSFYRHRKTGYETVDAGRLSAYAQTLKQEVMTEHPPPAKYIDGDSPLFERIASFEARFNRALIYPGNVLHSGDIRQVLPRDTPPRMARLTANTLIRLD
jgi:hypothetical protein